jgi:hypothetical protein
MVQKRFKDNSQKSDSRELIDANFIEPAGRPSTRTKEWLSTSKQAMDGLKEIQRQHSKI